MKQSRIKEFIILVIVTLFIFTLFLVFGPLLMDHMEHYGTLSCDSSLNHIAQGLLNFHKQNSRFPGASEDVKGNACSWRVSILPFLGYQDLAKQYRYDQRWDSAENKKLNLNTFTSNGLMRTEHTSAFHCSKDPGPADNTSYVTVVGANTAMRNQKSASLAQIPGTKVVETDGKDPYEIYKEISGNASNTILIVEMHNSGIHWLEPRDLSFNDAMQGINAGSRPGISSPHTFWINRTRGSGTPAVFADGSVRFLNANLDPEILRSLLEIDSKDKPQEKFGSSR